MELEEFGETYEITAPTISVHNIIIGTSYIDIGGTGSCRLLGNKELKCTIHFTKKGWLSKDEYKCEGEVVKINVDAKGKSKKSDNQLLYKINGNWNNQISVSKYVNGKVDESTSELVFSKYPYPENWEYMYGLSHFAL